MCLILAKYLSGINGLLPARIRSEVVWNSTANLLGKPGHNIALDLVNEFLNNEFKGRRPLIKKLFRSLYELNLWKIFYSAPFTGIYFILTANLKNSHGQYTETQVSRCSKIVGSVGKAIEEILQVNVIQDYIPRSPSSDGSSKAKLKKFIEEYGMEDLFVDKGDERHHSGFNDFRHNISVKKSREIKCQVK